MSENPKLKIKTALIGAVVAIFLIGLIVAVLLRSDKLSTADSLDDFARCLKDKGAVMYGAEWCPHCQNEKKAFGDSFKFISYVECPKEPDTCIQKQIQGYPTWIFADGRRFEGEQGLYKLSSISGCQLPQ